MRYPLIVHGHGCPTNAVARAVVQLNDSAARYHALHFGWCYWLDYNLIG
ncbi:Uncharacterised protein [Vibrio cholerae]|nr:Uncharacterised protein [Vibrio cholerae]